MVELIKARKKLAPIRLELSREMDGDVVETLCEYLEVDASTLDGKSVWQEIRA